MKSITVLQTGVKALEMMHDSMDELGSAVSTMLESECSTLHLAAEGGAELADEQTVQEMINKAFKELGIADILDQHVAEQMQLVGSLERQWPQT